MPSAQTTRRVDGRQKFASIGPRSCPSAERRSYQPGSVTAMKPRMLIDAPAGLLSAAGRDHGEAHDGVIIRSLNSSSSAWRSPNARPISSVASTPVGRSAARSCMPRRANPRPPEPPRGVASAPHIPSAAATGSEVQARALWGVHAGPHAAPITTLARQSATQRSRRRSAPRGRCSSEAKWTYASRGHRSAVGRRRSRSASWQRLHPSRGGASWLGSATGGPA